jgi:hypothetical protein
VEDELIVLGGLVVLGGAAYYLFASSSAEASVAVPETAGGSLLDPSLLEQAPADVLSGEPAPATGGLDVGGWFTSLFGASTPDPPSSDLPTTAQPGGLRLTGAVSAQVAADEQPIIVQVAQDAGIDPALLAALRVAENGGPQSVNPNYPKSGNPYRGGEFGIQTLRAPSFTEQAQIAATTIVKTIGRYQSNTGRSASANGRYTADFLRYFSQGGPGYGGYAPTGADPLNAHHYLNLLTAYQGSGVIAA